MGGEPLGSSAGSCYTAEVGRARVKCGLPVLLETSKQMSKMVTAQAYEITGGASCLLEGCSQHEWEL